MKWLCVKTLSNIMQYNCNTYDDANEIEDTNANVALKADSISNIFR